MLGLRTANQARPRLVGHGGDPGGGSPAEASTLATRVDLLFHALERFDRVRDERGDGIHRDGQEEDEEPAEYPHTAASYHGFLRALRTGGAVEGI